MTTAVDAARHVVEPVVRAVELAIEVVAGSIILVVTVAALWSLARAALAREIHERARSIRLHFGRGLVMALEFFVAADVLSTIIAPTLESVLIVGVTVVLRTILAVAVEWELRQVERERH